ncbi:MAG TPA: GxxExxY protein [Caulobacteraceae bacterium]|jgi:GxxExxY protein
MTQEEIRRWPQMTADRRDERTYAIIGAAIAAHRELGAGFLEAVYREALAIELKARANPFRREASLKIAYRDTVLSVTYRADFLCFDNVILEVKALARLSSVEEAQLINYLRASRIESGLLLNFGASRLEHRRFVLSQNHLRSSAAICGSNE